jgi:hypothetical protein
VRRLGVLAGQGAPPAPPASTSIEICRQPWGADNLVAAGAPAGGGVLSSLWVQVRPQGAPPWYTSNVEVYNLFASGSWALRGVMAAGATDAADSYVDMVHMFQGYRAGSFENYANDYAYLVGPSQPLAVSAGWCWFAWQIVCDAVGATFRSWLKSGMTGAVIGPSVQVRTWAQVRGDLMANSGWTQAEADAWVPSVDAREVVIGTRFDKGNSSVSHARAVALVTEPTLAELDVIARRQSPDAAAWGDWELAWDAGPVLANRGGGGGPALVVQPGGTVYAGAPGPVFP